LRDDCRGSTAIEAAVVLPMLLLLIFGGMEFANVMWTQNSLSYAVQRAARCAAVDSGSTGACKTAAQIQGYAAGLTMADGVTSAAFTIKTGNKTQCYGGSQINSYQVTATYAYKTLLIGLPLPALTLTATACYPA